MEEDYISGTLEHLRDQTIPFDEIIIVDAASTDETVSLASGLADNIIILEERGISLGRNVGAKESFGDVLAFVDADTWVSRRLCQTIKTEFTDPDLVVGVTKYLGSKKNITTDFVYWCINIIAKISSRFRKPQFAGSCLVCRKSTFDEVGGFDEARMAGEDSYLTGRLSKLGKTKILNIYSVTSSRRFEKHGPLSIVKYLLTLWGSIFFDHNYTEIR